MKWIRRHPGLALGLAITLLFLWLGLFRLDFLEILERKFYDLRMQLLEDTDTTSEIVLVKIDDDSIEKLGRWPWPRQLVAQGIEKINAGAPRVIGLNFIFSEAEKSAGLKEIDQLDVRLREEMAQIPVKPRRQLLQAIEAAQKRLDNDGKLASAISASGKVVLPIYFKDSNGRIAAPDEAEKQRLKSSALANVQFAAEAVYPRAGEVVMPIPAFLSPAAGVGHINLGFDLDGVARKERLVYHYQGLFLPAYTLRLAANYMGLDDSQLKVDLGRGIFLGATEIPLTYSSEMLVGFKGPRDTFKSYSFFDVVNDKIPSAVFRNKLVLVGASATGLTNPISTPTDATMPLEEFSANAVWSILNGRHVDQPGWTDVAELLLILLVGVLIAGVLPRMRAAAAGITFWGTLILMLAAAVYFFVSKNIWLQVTYPVVQLIFGYIGVVSINYFVTESGKQKVESESAETNRMLGLSLQEQGMLDMAFDKFRRIPVDDQAKDLLYNLALDYERKRQLNKAASVYAYIEEFDEQFKDVAERRTKLNQASETLVFQDSNLASRPKDDLTVTGTGTKPRLGRYEISSQLGKGAMGVVYLGLDPRINRTTAIKTFRFPEEIEATEIKKLKTKFFREAQSAGTLSHPNIVTIYDAGEEQDLAYIAMEFLEGEDLKKYTPKENLLPIRRVIDIMADVSEALSYAHQKGIVHRDIKPANIMVLSNGTVKITDFGIARITATSQTQTGVVKGTPYYMSPEQFSGEKVDGRSDIFSLGTTVYQLLTGALPFTGESPPALMNAIMNTPHADPRTINPKIFSPLVKILDKALQKKKENRYQNAMAMAVHLRQLSDRIDLALARKKAVKQP